MARIARVVIPGCLRHVTHRGNHRQLVFLNDDDRWVYLDFLRSYLAGYSTRLAGYSLMGNHTHLAPIPERTDSLARTIGRAHQDYSRWFQLRRNQTGHLWQYRYFSCPVEDERFHQVLAYITPSIAIGELVHSQSVTRRVTNIGPGSATYTASFTGMAGFDVSITRSVLTLGLGQTGTFTVTFTRTTAAMNAYSGGQLTWSDGVHLVRIPMVVRPIPLAAPAEVSGSYNVTFGYSGAFNATARGPVRLPSGGGAAPSALSLLLDDAQRHRLRRRYAHAGLPRSPHTLPYSRTGALRCAPGARCWTCGAVGLHRRGDGVGDAQPFPTATGEPVQVDGGNGSESVVEYFLGSRFAGLNGLRRRSTRKMTANLILAEHNRKRWRPGPLGGSKLSVAHGSTYSARGTCPLRFLIIAVILVPFPLSSAERPYEIRHVPVYREAGRFGGWPANHGIWSWGDEILVGFSAAWFQRQNPEVHQYDRSKPEEPRLARSLDGGLTWAVETPSSLLPPEQGGNAVSELKEPLDFTAPGFAMTLRLTDINAGASRLYFSTDRGRTWHGPFSFPLFGQKGVAARTDYVVLGRREAIVFLTAAKSNGREGRPFAATTRDGGLSWQFLSWIGPEPPGFAIMPSALRLGADEFLVAVRCKEGERDWIDLHHSADGARSWQWRSRVAETTSGKSGNPPSMVRLADGRIAVTYGRRAPPFGIYARVSEDRGRTWNEEIVLRDDGAAWDLGYPRTAVRPDGTLVTVYYFAARAERERTIEATLWKPPAPGLRIERVLGPEVTHTGPYKHPAAIAELANGDLYIVWYGGQGEYAVETAVWGTRIRRGESRWSEPRRIASDPLRSVGNAVIWQAPDGVVWLFYVVRHGQTWSDSRIQGKISRDGAETWSDSFVVSEQPGMMVRGRPLEIAGGGFLLPVYHETGHDTESVGAESTSLFLRFDPSKRTFTPSAPIRSRNGNIQPAVAALDADHLVAYCRRGGGYGPGWKGYIVQAYSSDGGLTWSEGRDSEFPNPNAAVDLLKLASGSLLLVFNDSMVDRTPLTLALSKDGGRSWMVRRNLAGGLNDYAYPYAVQGRDGTIHIVYTSNGRTVVNHAAFREDWLAGQPGVRQ